MKFWSILPLVLAIVVSACSKSATNTSNQNQVEVRKRTVRIGEQNTEQTTIYTPYLQEVNTRSADGKLNLRALTATIHDNAHERLEQVIFFDGVIISQVSMVTYNKFTKTIKEAQYAPDGTFLMQRTNQEEWSDQNGKPLSRPEQVASMKLRISKSIDISKVEMLPGK